MITSPDQPGTFQDLARISAQVIDGFFSMAVTGSLVLVCLLITPFFFGAHYWNCLIKHGQHLKLKG